MVSLYLLLIPSPGNHIAFRPTKGHHLKTNTQDISAVYNQSPNSSSIPPDCLDNHLYGKNLNVYPQNHITELKSRSIFNNWNQIGYQAFQEIA